MASLTSSVRIGLLNHYCLESYIWRARSITGTIHTLPFGLGSFGNPAELSTTTLKSSALPLPLHWEKRAPLLLPLCLEKSSSIYSQSHSRYIGAKRAPPPLPLLIFNWSALPLSHLQTKCSALLFLLIYIKLGIRITKTIFEQLQGEWQPL